MKETVGDALTEDALNSAEQFRRTHDSAVLTIAFTDIARSTELRETLGEREYERLRVEHESELSTIVSESEAGQVVKGLGDGSLIVFEKPSVAVDRLLEFQESNSAHPHFQLRIGVDLGEVTRQGRGRMVSDVFGRHVNRAARIQALAEPGHVLTSYGVYDCSVLWLKDRGVNWYRHGRYPLKGFSDRQELYEPYRGNDAIPQKTIVAPVASFIAEGNLEVQFSPSEREESSRRPPASDVSPVGQGVARSVRKAVDRPRIRRTPIDLSSKQGGDVFAFFGYRISISSNAYRERLGRKPEVLWVDDFPENNRALMALLKTSQCEVKAVTSTEEAIAALQEKGYSLIITDMGRGTNLTAGLDLLSAIHNSKRYTPSLVFASLNAVSRFGRQAKKLGALVCTAGFVTLLDAVHQVFDWWGSKDGRRD